MKVSGKFNNRVCALLNPVINDMYTKLPKFVQHEGNYCVWTQKVAGARGVYINPLKSTIAVTLPSNVDGNLLNTIYNKLVSELDGIEVVAEERDEAKCCIRVFKNEFLTNTAYYDTQVEDLRVYNNVMFTLRVSELVHEAVKEYNIDYSA